MASIDFTLKAIINFAKDIITIIHINIIKKHKDYFKMYINIKIIAIINVIIIRVFINTIINYIKVNCLYNVIRYSNYNFIKSN